MKSFWSQAENVYDPRDQKKRFKVHRKRRVNVHKEKGEVKRWEMIEGDTQRGKKWMDQTFLSGDL